MWSEIGSTGSNERVPLGEERDSWEVRQRSICTQYVVGVGAVVQMRRYAAARAEGTEYVPHMRNMNDADRMRDDRQTLCVLVLSSVSAV
jgi:hypothetical protein